MTNTKNLTEGGLLTALAVVFALLALNLPVLGVVVMFLYPLPLLVLTYKQGLKTGLLSMLATFFLLAMLIDPVLALRFTVGSLIASLVIGIGFRAQKPATYILLTGLVAELISIVLGFLLVFAITGINPIDSQVQLMQETMQEALAINESLGLSQEDLAQQQQGTELILDILGIILPSGLIFAGLLATWLNYLIGGQIIKRLGGEVPSLPPFGTWKLPSAIALVFGFSLLAIYWGSSRDLTLLYEAGINGFIISLIFGFIQGANMLKALFIRFNIANFIYIFALIFVMLNPFLAQIVAFAGLIDMLFNYTQRLYQRKDRV